MLGDQQDPQTLRQAIMYTLYVGNNTGWVALCSQAHIIQTVSVLI